MENRPQSIAEYLNLIIGAAEGGDQSALYRIGQYAVKALNKVDEKPGARWVKASDFKYEIGMPYHAKDSRFKGAGHFNSNGAFIWGDCTVTHPKDQDELYILDESAAGREEDNSVEFAEWLYKNRWFSFVNNKWYYTFEQGTSMSDKQYQKEYIKTTDQLYELFKQQKEK